jgi:hypothetical protein
MNRFALRNPVLVAVGLLVWIGLFWLVSADFLPDTLSRRLDRLPTIFANLPGQLLWLVLLILTFFVSVWLLLTLADHFAPPRLPAPVLPDALQPVHGYAILLRDVGRGAWFERQVSARLADLALHALGEREPLSRSALIGLLNQGAWPVSAPVRVFLLQGLRTGAEQGNSRDEGHATGRPADEVLADVRATLAFLEAQTGSGEREQ